MPIFSTFWKSIFIILLYVLHFWNMICLCKESVLEPLCIISAVLFVCLFFSTNISVDCHLHDITHKLSLHCLLHSITLTLPLLFKLMMPVYFT